MEIMTHMEDQPLEKTFSGVVRICHKIISTRVMTMPYSRMFFCAFFIFSLSSVEKWFMATTSSSTCSKQVILAE